MQVINKRMVKGSVRTLNLSSWDMERMIDKAASKIHIHTWGENSPQCLCKYMSTLPALIFAFHLTPSTLFSCCWGRSDFVCILSNLIKFPFRVSVFVFRTSVLTFRRIITFQVSRQCLCSAINLYLILLALQLKKKETRKWNGDDQFACAFGCAFISRRPLNGLRTAEQATSNSPSPTFDPYF